MSAMRSAPTVRQVTIAAMLGALPSVASAQKAADIGTMTGKTSEPTARAVAARAIPRGAVLAAADIAYSSQERAKHPVPHSVALLDTLPTPARPNDSLIGWTARRMIKAGEALRTPAIVAPLVMQPGDLVDLEWVDGSILITARGRVNKAASLGEKVTVRLASQRSIDGHVIGAGRVRVD